MTIEQTITSIPSIAERQAAKPRKPIHPESDATYNRLRANIRNRFKSLVEQGTPIVSVSEGLHNGFDMFRAQISPDDQNHYNCNCCRAFFTNAAGLAYLNDKFQLVNVLSEVFSETFGLGAPTVVNVRELNTSVTVELSTATKNTWDHFYAFDPEEAQKLNSLGAIDSEFVNTMSSTARKTNLDALEKAVAHLNEALYRPESIGLLKPFIKLLRDHERAKVEHQKVISLHHVFAILYLTTEYSWLKGLRSSMAGSVLSFIEDNVFFKRDLLNPNGLKGLVNFINEATDPITYKRAVAEASAQAIERDVKKLAELGVPRFLERKRATKADLNVIWEQDPEVEDVEENTSGLTATEIVMKKVISDKTPSPKKQVDKFAEMIEAAVIRKNVSMNTFVSMLDQFAHIRYILSDARGCMLTKPVDDTDYSPVTDSALQARFLSHVSVTPRHGEHHNYGVVIPSIVEYDHKTHLGYIAENPAFKDEVESVVANLGSCVLGTDIRSSLYDHARGWTEVSKSLPLQEADGDTFYGMSLGVGATLTVVRKDGVAIIYTITSRE